MRLPHAFSALAVVVVAIAAALAVVQPWNVVPRRALAPQFELTKADGATVSSDELRGRMVLYTFTYTRCAKACPQTNDVLRAVASRLPGGSERLDIAYVAISFDAAHDTPDALRSYARSTNAGADWQFLTGAPAALKWAIGGFNVFYEARSDGSFSFDPTIILVDQDGYIRGNYRTRPSVERIVHDVESVAREARESRGLRRYTYEAAHLLVCSAQ